MRRRRLVLLIPSKRDRRVEHTRCKKSINAGVSLSNETIRFQTLHTQVQGHASFSINRACREIAVSAYDFCSDIMKREQTDAKIILWIPKWYTLGRWRPHYPIMCIRNMCRVHKILDQDLVAGNAKSEEDNESIYVTSLGKKGKKGSFLANKLFFTDMDWSNS